MTIDRRSLLSLGLAGALAGAARPAEAQLPPTSPEDAVAAQADPNHRARADHTIWSSLPRIISYPPNSITASFPARCCA